MRLTSVTGESVAITIVGYEFPGIEEGDEWLVVRCDVIEAVGAWSFTAAAMIAEEAAEFGAWLTAVARGDEVSGFWFTEPDFVFEPPERAEGFVRLTLVLHDRRRIALSTSPAALTGAAADWTAEAERFPDRWTGSK